MKYLNDENIKTIKLKPCPFCGNEAEITEKDDTDEGYSIRVGCHKCFCNITKNLWFDFNESIIQYNVDVMIRKWNERKENTDKTESKE